MRTVTAMSDGLTVAIPLNPSVEWFQHVACLAQVWPDDHAPEALWQAVAKYHRAMVDACIVNVNHQHDPNADDLRAWAAGG
jgi:hypothetical protein